MFYRQRWTNADQQTVVAELNCSRICKMLFPPHDAIFIPSSLNRCWILLQYGPQIKVTFTITGGTICSTQIHITFPLYLTLNANKSKSWLNTDIITMWHLKKTKTFYKMQTVNLDDGQEKTRHLWVRHLDFQIYYSIFSGCVAGGRSALTNESPWPGPSRRGARGPGAVVWWPHRAIWTSFKPTPQQAKCRPTDMPAPRTCSCQTQVKSVTFT